MQGPHEKRKLADIRIYIDQCAESDAPHHFKMFNGHRHAVQQSATEATRWEQPHQLAKLPESGSNQS
jgi:hypothetical protein